MEDIRTITTRALHDALALRGLEENGVGFVRTSSPETYMTLDRLRFAREVLRHLPQSGWPHDAAEVIDQLVPVVTSAMRPSHT